MILRRKNVIIEKTDSESQVANQIQAEVQIRVFKALLFGFIFFCTLSANHIQAQCLPKEMPFNHGESVNYDIYLKWGLLMSRAGQGRISFHKSTYKGQSASKYQLVFQTTKFFDAIFKMRDTLECYYNQNYSLLYSTKRTTEGSRYVVDDLTFSYTGNKTKIRSHRYTPSATKIDTILTVVSGCTSDMLGATFFLRTLDWDNLKIGESHSSTVAIGHSLVKINFSYRGQSIVERDDVKYRTHYFLVDIFDDAFEQSKSAAELWVGDDENHIPIKIRTKLKVGYAEVYYKNSGNLKAPLTCRVEMKRLVKTVQ